jgi:hypothetical protein
VGSDVPVTSSPAPPPLCASSIVIVMLPPPAVIMGCVISTRKRCRWSVLVVAVPPNDGPQFGDVPVPSVVYQSPMFAQRLGPLVWKNTLVVPGAVCAWTCFPGGIADRAATKTSNRMEPARSTPAVVRFTLPRRRCGRWRDLTGRSPCARAGLGSASRDGSTAAATTRRPIPVNSSRSGARLDAPVLLNRDWNPRSTTLTMEHRKSREAVGIRETERCYPWKPVGLVAASAQLSAFQPKDRLSRRRVGRVRGGGAGRGVRLPVRVVGRSPDGETAGSLCWTAARRFLDRVWNAPRRTL